MYIVVGTQYKRIRMWVSMSVEDVVELWTCMFKKRSEDVVKCGRSKNLIRT